jgi:hypothetical protein
MFKKIVSVAAVSLIASIGAAQAGGLFGCKGSGALFRGDVGCAVAPVQKQLLTPALQGAVELGGAAVGGYYGGPAGAQMGGMVGGAINNAFAGGGRFEAAQMQQQAPYPVQQQAPQMGNFCIAGGMRVGPGPFNPVGSPCQAMTPHGPLFGQVGF